MLKQKALMSIKNKTNFLIIKWLLVWVTPFHRRARIYSSLCFNRNKNPDSMTTHFDRLQMRDKNDQNSWKSGRQDAKTQSILDKLIRKNSWVEVDMIDFVKNDAKASDLRMRSVRFELELSGIALCVIFDQKSWSTQHI